MLTIDAKRLLHAVRAVRLADERSTQTSMTLRGHGGTLVLDATVGDMHVSQTFSATGDGLAATTVSCQELHEALKGEAVSSVTLQRDGDRLILTLGQTQVEIGANNGGDAIPPTEPEPRQVLGTLDSRELTKALRTILYARSLDDDAKPKTGVLIESSSDGLRLVATDGHRLGCVTLEQPESTDLEAIMPGSFVDTLLRFAKRSSVSFSVTGEYKDGILATGGDWSIRAPVVPGTFPRYRNVMPDSMPGRLPTHRKAMIALLKSIIPQLQKDKNVLFTRHRAGLMIEAGKEHIVFEQADTSGMTTFLCNPDYLLDVFTACDSDWVTLETTQTFLRRHGPAMIRDGQVTHLLMPVRPALGETDELCPYCGRRFSPDAESNPLLPWKHIACSRECARLLEVCRSRIVDNRISPRSTSRLRHSA